MLTIRQEQLDAMAAARWDDFARRAIAQVRSAQPVQTAGVSDAAMRARFERAAQRAARFGLQTEMQIVALFEASVLLGDGFEQRPEHAWAMDLLESRYLSPDDRALLVLARAKAEG